jgi:4-diphosphocytidyl-2-C-methyl-D-erythritol kinase
VASRRSSDAALSTRACAKINLTLRLTGRRPDGYHELRTVLLSLALHDTLTFRARPGPLQIDCDDPACPTDRTNLVWRAAEHVWRAAGRRGAARDVAVRIEKRIPIEAGLGGGSSDAAAAIRVLNRIWRVDLSSERQYAIAARLGADVPFFLEGGTALGVDRGDLLFPLAELPPTWVTLVVPSFRVSTKDAYQWWDESPGASSRRPSLGWSKASGRETGWLPSAFAVSLSKGELTNDLQGPVAARHPEIAQIVRALGRRGATHAAMSGSGSAVFGLFPSKPSADRAAVVLATGGRRALVSRTVTRAKYRRLCAPR